MNMLKAIQAGANAAVAADPRPLAVKPTYKLVSEKTGAEITLPARMKCWDGAEIVVKAFRPSRFQSSGGYIQTDLNEVFVPSVVGAKIVAVTL